MGSNANTGWGERSGFAGCDPTMDRLVRELACLIDLGALTTEEAEAFRAVLDDLYLPLARSGASPASDLRGACGGRGQDRSRIARLLATDLDLAFQRLSYGV